MRTLLLVLMLAVNSYALDFANVIALSCEDTAKIKKLYDQKILAEKAFDDAQEDVKKRYLLVRSGDPDAGNYFSGTGFVYRKGWSDGNFIFTEDFKYIVPSTTHPSINSCCGGGIIWNGTNTLMNTVPLGGTTLQYNSTGSWIAN